MRHFLEVLKAFDFRTFAPKIPVSKQAGKLLVTHSLGIKPQSLPNIRCDSSETWERMVDDFDRFLLGILNERKIGLHFTAGNWDMTLEQDPSLNGLIGGENRAIHYAGVDPELGRPQVLNLLPSWVSRNRDFLIVIDRELEVVKGIEELQKFPGSRGHITIPAPSKFPIFPRSTWLVKEPIPLFSALDLARPFRLEDFVKLKYFYQCESLHALDSAENRGFHIMLFAVANGLRLLQALEGS